MALSDVKQREMLDRLVMDTATVYSLPLIYEHLSELIDHPRSSIDDIAKVISEDQGLTARILKLANSPMFGYFSRIDSISKAVTIIGTQQIRDLALAMSAMNVFKGIPQELIDMTSFWRHGIACGIVARALAIYRRETNVERFFAAGLLHDIGLLVMCVAIPDLVREMLAKAWEEGALYYRCEEERLGFTHAVMGGELLSHWKIPMRLAEPVSRHHSPAAAERYPIGAAMIHLADIICQAFELGCSGERFVPPLDPGSWELLDIPAAALPLIARQSEPQLKEAFTILGADAP